MAESPKKAKGEKPDHPTYHHMVLKALAELAEGKKGTSKIAIGKYVVANFNVKPNYTARIRTALKKLLETGAIIQSKGTGCTGSFKLAEAKKVKKEVKKAKKTGAGRPKKSPTKKSPTKKTATKKSMPKPKVAKSPKKPSGKGRGRPKKDPAEKKAAPAASGAKKGRGRPKKQ